jgi:hypothetical protein
MSQNEEPLTTPEEEPNETLEMPEGAVDEPIETVFESDQGLEEEPEPVLVEEVVDVEPETVQTVQEFATPPIPPEEPKKSNNTPWIILLVILLVMCCCCVVVTGGVLWSFGDILFGL